MFHLMKSCMGIPLDRDKEGSHTPDRVPPDGMCVLEVGARLAWVTSCHQGPDKEKLEDVAGRDAGRNVSK